MIIILEGVVSSPGFELITNNSNSNTFDVSLLKYYITNNELEGVFKNIQLS